MGITAAIVLAFLATVAIAAPSTLSTAVTCPDGNVAQNPVCCPFFALRDDLLENLFQGVCGEDAHQAVRLIFHDAIGFSTSMEKQGIFSGGGADGSVLMFPDIEANRAENNGIADGVDGQLPFLAAHPVTAADLVYFAAAVGITNCPGAPRLKFFAGRPNATAPPPEGLVPAPEHSVTQIINRFADASDNAITPSDIIALLASHSIANQDHVDETVAAAPFDSTQNTFDTQFFLEVLLKGTGFPGTGNNTGEVSSPLPLGDTLQPGEIRLQSDFALARDPRTACIWQSFINQQQFMQEAFVGSVDKMARIGLKNPGHLVDCSDVIPQPVAAVTKHATYPATKSFKDIELACVGATFPSLATDPGATETLVDGQVGT